MKQEKKVRKISHELNVKEKEPEIQKKNDEIKKEPQIQPKIEK